MKPLIKLKKLFKDLPIDIKGSKDLEISGISNNSKRVVPGHLFIARRGKQFDGNTYIDEAVHNGAVAVVTAHFNPFVKHVTQIIHPQPQEIEALLADRFYEHPSTELCIFAATGTNGKTTVCSLIQQLLHEIKKSPQTVCGFVGTVGYDTGRSRYHADHTTPDSLTLQKMLREMVSYGCEFCAMEATSHGLSQGRIDHVQLAVGIFTNLSRDHLDYHGSMESYAAAKSRLFDSTTYARNMHTAVINSDDETSESMIQNFTGKVIRYGHGEQADLQIVSSRLHAEGSDIRLKYGDKLYDVPTALVGEHNIMNAIAALGALLSEGMAIGVIIEGLRHVKSVRGRLERVETPKGSVYVDFAHTPDALDRALQTLRKVHPSASITCLFGCGGDRDPGKRPLMGRIAQMGSDCVIVTSDNPRTEQPEKIIEQILQGMDSQKPILIEAERSRAIALALKRLNGSDVLIIAGKGHETHQIVGSRVLPFDDAQLVREWFHAPQSSL